MLLTRPRHHEAAETLTSTDLPSPGLEVILQLLREPGKKYRILDLGPPLQKNIEFFSQLSCKHYVDDVWSVLAEHPQYTISRQDKSSEFTKQDFQDFIHYEDVQFDVILAWDLLNYFNSRALSVFLRYISGLGKPGSVFHFLINTSKYMPVQPARITACDNNVFHYAPQVSAVVPASRYSPKAVESVMDGYKIFKLSLLGNGIQEHLFFQDAGGETS